MSLKLGTTSIPGIRVIEDSGGSSGGVDSGVVFIDYDGTEIETWQASEVAGKSALPANPTHTGLMAQGWNWSLADIKSYIASYPEADVVVGQMYATASGATEIDIELDDANYLSPYLFLYVNGTVTIDWGDNSSTDTVTGASITTATFTQHVYSSVGNYTISIKETTGNYALGGPGSQGVNYGSILTSDNNTSSISYDGGYYKNRIISVRIGVGMLQIRQTYLFYGCFNLETVTFHSLLTYYSNAYGMFGYCFKLKCIIIPTSFTATPSSLAENCYNLKYISLPNTITTLGTSLTTYSQIKNLTIPLAVTQIPNTFLTYCVKIQKFLIPNSVTIIGGTVFSYCYNLYIEGFNNIESIGGNIGLDNRGIQSITLPSTLTTLSDNAFRGWRRLSRIINNSDITSITMSNTYGWTDCNSLSTIPFSFAGTSIPNSYFQNCYTLTQINLPNDYTTIGSSAFYNCYRLGPVFTIPSTVTSIGNSAFYACSGLKEIHIQATTPPTLGGTSVFNNTNSQLKIYVPQGTLSAYQTATNWATHASKMLEEPS